MLDGEVEKQLKIMCRSCVLDDFLKNKTLETKFIDPKCEAPVKLLATETNEGKRCH